MDWVWMVVRLAGVSAAIYGVIALGLIVSDPSRAVAGKGLNFDALQRADGGTPEMWRAPDGVELAVRRHRAGRAGVPLVVLVHGSGGHGASYDPLGRAIAGAGAADVLVPDLRGHGASGERPGDVDYIGQLEDDLAALIAANRAPGQKVVLAGHSSGGGLVIRFAGGAHGGMLDGAVLLAPFLKYNAPSMRENSGGWAVVQTRRVIGLVMVNAVGITVLNHLPVIRFNVPDGWQGMGMRDRYSFAMNTSYAPRSDWQADAAALPPYLLVVGAQDEAFRAEAFEPALSAANPAGQFVIVPGAGHLDIFSNPATEAAMLRYLEGL